MFGRVEVYWFRRDGERDGEFLSASLQNLVLAGLRVRAARSKVALNLEQAQSVTTIRCHTISAGGPSCPSSAAYTSTQDPITFAAPASKKDHGRSKQPLHLLEATYMLSQLNLNQASYRT